mmetsp:Transcript_128996/g.413208  ORF Transcript_128996/g.413208 Transcript_128996/m.413208 type:complete len:277 (-) Transcript_128996:673-1503(-)
MSGLQACGRIPAWSEELTINPRHRPTFFDALFLGLVAHILHLLALQNEALSPRRRVKLHQALPALFQGEQVCKDPNFEFASSDRDVQPVRIIQEHCMELARPLHCSNRADDNDVAFAALKALGALHDAVLFQPLHGPSRSALQLARKEANLRHIWCDDADREIVFRLALRDKQLQSSQDAHGLPRVHAGEPFTLVLEHAEPRRVEDPQRPEAEAPAEVGDEVLFELRSGVPAQHRGVGADAALVEGGVGEGQDVLVHTVLQVQQAWGVPDVLHALE